MNVYVIVEGSRTEKLVYTSWIRYINPTLTYAPRIENVSHNNYYIEEGGGLPLLYEAITGAVANVATMQQHGNNLFDRLVVAVDSENMSLADRYSEIQDKIAETCAPNGWAINYKIVVQHFCFEAWALGNRKLIKGNLSDSRVLQYVKDYNVSMADPELLPDRPSEQMNRSQHAKKYLKLLFNERYPKQGFSPVNPGPMCHPHYFEQVKTRRKDTSHIKSFGAMLAAFV